MLLHYTLMKKNIPVADLVLDEIGSLVEATFQHKELAPVCDVKNRGLSVWWKNRCVPANRDRLQECLKQNGVSIPEEYMVKNLGLSLTDTYWIQPKGEPLCWEQVNLFDNDFLPDNTGHMHPHETGIPPAYSPDSTLQGQVEKAWRIVGSDRCLIKGNSFRTSLQCLNEVTATRIHAEQKHDNFTRYELIRIRNRMYDFGCLCRNFCDQHKEFVPAWDILQAHKEVPQDNPYEAFVLICTKIYGMEEGMLRNDLEYQIETDFLLSNADRHLNNLGVLRNADTGEFLRMAPIFDTGNSLFFNGVPFTDRTALAELEVHSFFPRELQMLAQIQTPGHVSIDRIPSFETLGQLYRMDRKIPEPHLDGMGAAFEKKKEMLEEFQRGKLIDRHGELIQTYSWLSETTERKPESQKQTKKTKKREETLPQTEFSFDDSAR